MNSKTSIEPTVVNLKKYYYKMNPKLKEIETYMAVDMHFNNSIHNDIFLNKTGHLGYTYLGRKYDSREWLPQNNLQSKTS